MNQDRRSFLKTIGKATFGAAVLSNLPSNNLISSSANADMFFDISLAEWSLHRALRGGELTNLEFITATREEYGIGAVEYVNQFFMDKAEDTSYLDEMNKRANDAGVRNVLIMIDGEGALGAADPKERQQAVENHYKWVDAAKYLGCHSIRVNARSSGTYKEQQQRAADGLRSLTEYGASEDINVIVENHGGLSSNGEWLSEVIEMVDHSHCGTLPDFGNFDISQNESYNRYLGVEQLMPYAKGVSAKTHNFNSDGMETETDYFRIMEIVRDAGYRGYVGIEYEGDALSEPDGIRATKKLLEYVGSRISS